jgi:hypothetical protein
VARGRSSLIRRGAWRYRGREEYLGRVATVALSLVRERLLLAEDVPRILERAAAHWDWRSAGEAVRAPTSPKAALPGGR